ncbi:MAG TPA: LysR family transcriptional regulator substrate-binding protein, partial [Turneriella sp.]|nr:LysR family transcriptional regulator substrate-binding protein [Turneriella sp.]
VDFALSPEMISEAAYVNRYLIEDQIVPVVSKDFPAASISDWQNLKRCDWILFHSGSAIRKISNQIFRDTERNFVPRVVMEFRSVPSLVRLLEEGVGVGFISKLSLSNKLMVIPLTHLHRKRRFFISYKKKHEQLAGVIETVLRCGGG